MSAVPVFASSTTARIGSACEPGVFGLEHSSNENLSFQIHVLPTRLEDLSKIQAGTVHGEQSFDPPHRINGDSPP